MESQTEDKADSERRYTLAAKDDLETVRTPNAHNAGAEEDLAMFRVECALARILPGLT